MEKVEEDEEGLCDQGALPAGSGMTNGELSRLSIVCPDAPTQTKTLELCTLETGEHLYQHFTQAVPLQYSSWHLLGAPKPKLQHVLHIGLHLHHRYPNYTNTLHSIPIPKHWSTSAC